MTYPGSLLVHSAQVQSGVTEGAENAYGKKAVTPVYATVSCRFGISSSTFEDSDSGYRIVKTPQCIFPAGTVTREGYLVTGLTEPFTKTYRIKAVNPALLARTVSHLVLDLEAVT